MDSLRASYDHWLPIRNARGHAQSLKVVDGVPYWLEGSPALELYRLPPTATAPEHVFALHEREGSMTKAEELQRERMRTSTHGISDFAVQPSTHRLLFIAHGDVYYFANSCGVVRVRDTVTPSTAAVGEWSDLVIIKPWGTVSFIMDHNVYLAELLVSTEGRLTATRVTAITTSGTEIMPCGVADFIMQEEFDLPHGFVHGLTSTVYTITDLTPVPMRLVWGDERMRYPRVGDRNAISVVAVVDRTTMERRMAPHLALLRVCPWAEYIVRFGLWGCHEERLFLWVLSRDQRQAALIDIAVADLPRCSESEASDGEEEIDEENVPVAVLREWDVPWAWVNVEGSPIVTHRGLMIAVNRMDDFGGMHFEEYDAETRVWTVRTEGRWNVHPSSARRVGDSMYFTGSVMGDPLSVALYRLPPNGPCVTQSVPVGFIHRFFCDGDGVVAVVASRSDEPPRLWLKRGDLWEPLAPLYNIPNGLLADIPKAVVYPVGEHMAVCEMMPSRPVAAAVPLLVYVYGGPHVQLVHNDNFFTIASPLFLAAVERGLAVAIVDGRMRNSNGLRVHATGRCRLGDFEGADYAEAVRAILARHQNTIDAGNVNVCGWSYGGYAALRSIAYDSQTFSRAFAGAPVGDWRLYDTGYTERYMGLLPSEEAAYNTSAIAAVAGSFPDGGGRVFIAHGLCDENVHIDHTTAIAHALTMANKSYALQVYPGERHGLRRSPQSMAHYVSSVLLEILRTVPQPSAT